MKKERDASLFSVSQSGKCFASAVCYNQVVATEQERRTEA